MSVIEQRVVACRAARDLLWQELAYDDGEVQQAFEIIDSLIEMLDMSQGADEYSSDDREAAA